MTAPVLTAVTAVPARPAHLSPQERSEIGLAARRLLPPAEQDGLTLPDVRPRPEELAQEVATTRVPELVPLRHSRMATSPFAYLRGNALGMAADMAATPVSGLSTQLCGDAHLSNFGLFGSAERRLLFDVNDFDETLPGPWEWDVKRLATSIVVAGRENGFSAKECRRTARTAVSRYCSAIAQFAGMGTLEVWYARVDADELAQLVRGSLDKTSSKRLDRALRKARGSGHAQSVAKLTDRSSGSLRFRSEPPELVPIGELLPDVDRDELEAHLAHFLARYRRTLAADRRTLLDRFELVDVARKVVGVGSVGTRCWIMLMRGRDDQDVMLLQVKEAQQSVLAPHVPPLAGRPRPLRNEGARVVNGQRLMQAAGDIFLGWNHMDGADGVERDFYVRQLKDMKGSAMIETMDPVRMGNYTEVCAWTLARAHARAGDAVAITAYLGDSDEFPKAAARFAERYADQNERDHAAFCEAIAEGRLTAAS
jgi:uncharacterized protein (DUF2252 family)